jgi:hypothetical protein
VIQQNFIRLSPQGLSWNQACNDQARHVFQNRSSHKCPLPGFMSRFCVRVRNSTPRPGESG